MVKRDFLKTIRTNRDTGFGKMVRSILAVFAHPLALIMTVFLVSFLCAEVLETGTKHPLELLLKFFDDESKKDNLNKLEKMGISLMKPALKFVVGHKDKVTAIVAMLITAVLRPSRTNIFLVSIAVTLILTINGIKVYDWLLAALFLFVFRATGSVEWRGTLGALAALVFVLKVVLEFELKAASPATGSSAQTGAKGVPYPK